MKPWAPALLCLALLALAAGAEAEPGSFHGRFGLPAAVQGSYEVSGLGDFLARGDAGQLALLVDGHSGKATRVIHRAFGYVSSSDPQAQVLWGEATERVDLDLAGSALTLTSRGPQFQLLSAGAATAWSTGIGSPALALGALREPIVVAEGLHAPISLHVSPARDLYEHTIEARQYAAGSPSGRIVAEGLHAFVSDARLTFLPAAGEARPIEATFRVEERPGTLYNPVTGRWTGIGTHSEYVQEVLLLEGAGRLQVQFKDADAAFYTALPVTAIQGEAHLPRVTGTVRVTQDGKEATHEIPGRDLTLGGRFTLRLHDLAGTWTQAEGDGDLTFVQYGAVTATYPWASVAAAVGIGALLVAAAAWLASQAKIAGAGLGGILAGYARVHGEDILEHPGRAEVYERVKAFPGVSFVQLASQVPFGDSTLTHHLRVLERNGFVTSVRDGRYVRFFDRQSGHYAGERKRLVTALRNPTSAAMARRVRDRPGIAQHELAAAFAVTASTVTWHMARLERAGLVGRQRDGAHTRYFLAAGWASLPAEEQARQGERGVAPLTLTA